ncbi:putative leucine-rich repeat-containing protein DDB_G0290503 [Diorhabda sublineata]|uniref:putative leucine-rich repeat-containing protein DDB_G0290503 n=1 Tax=Diorhabda sublineata TaxID=1163346 RepID=UPI0024E092BB|nr:putative leucine-rich repeat-containing protein DDB_G0290503 [Diorhabda sublineata]
MDTTITISSKHVKNKSDFLHLTYNAGNNEDAIISVDSSNFGQSGTVTWDKKCSTISNIEKVTNWMKHSDKECVEEELVEFTKSNEDETKSLILFRCDFNKSTKISNYYPNNSFNKTSLISYFKDENGTSQNSTKVSTIMENNIRVSEQKLSAYDDQSKKTEMPSSKISQSDRSFTSENKSDNTDEVPLSPETRKKELCHYLQLMNPSDKKEILILQNRRSSRVRNLAEQKQFQEKLKEINNDNEKDKTESIEKSVTLKSFKELNVHINKLEDEEKLDKTFKHFVFPFPPEHLSEVVNDFDTVMYKLIPKLKRFCSYKNIPYLTKNNTQVRSLRSHNTITKKSTEKKQISKKNRTRKSKSVPPSSIKSRQNSPVSTRSTRYVSPSKSISSQCEIISVGDNHDDDNVDVDQIMDDMIDFEKLSDEHKKCLIESRILSTKPFQPSYNSKTIGLNVISPLYGFSKTDTNEISKICEKYKKSISSGFVNNICKELKDSTVNVTNIQKNNDNEDKNNKLETSQVSGGNTYVILNIHTPNSSEDITQTSEHSSNSSFQDHDYASCPSKNSESHDNDDLEINTLTGNHLEVNTKTISQNSKFEILPYKKSDGTKSLHKSLQCNSRKRNKLVNSTMPHEWDIGTSLKPTLKRQSHYIKISRENGCILKAFYIGYNLIICQEFLVSFWMQTPLGNVLGSQNMWIPRGQTQRMVLNNRCLQKDSMEKVICLETSVVYIELWMKEHKSEMRQGPVADVFVTVYFWKQRQNGLDKKVLQLENINGFADDVQYCVMRRLPKIIVSWHSTCDESVSPRKTFIHAYQLASDYQTVSNIFDIEPVSHYVSSLHNIDDFDDLIMGCGENKITLWNIEFGHIIATIELNEIKTPLSTLWVKCDRGFLFALQQCVDRELRLIAINGINHSWKKLASYFPPEGFDRLKGVCIENGLLLSFYDQGILCWNAETGEPIEEINTEHDLILSGVHIIRLEDDQVIVKHVLAHLLSLSIEES